MELIKTECLVCGKITTDGVEISILNDLDATCPMCGAEFVKWTRDNGDIVITLNQELDGLTTNEHLTYFGGK